jgi:hypothetical protein
MNSLLVHAAGRSLDRDFPFGRPHLAWAVFRPAFVSEDRLCSLQVQQRSAAIDLGLEDRSIRPPTSKIRFRLYSI